MVRYIEAKSILSKLRGQDNQFGITYNMNLYRGCQHGCIYCDTRSECYGVGDITEISVKRNALALLDRELSAKKGRKATVGTGSMNDPYMPVEAELRMTRGALETIARHRFPVHVITKSDLVVRDSDVLADISATYAAVSFTVTTADETLCRKIEPLAPPVRARFRAMEQLAARGVYTGVTLMPLLPFINDTVENVAGIIRMAADAGASYVLPMFGTTLRKGSRDYFYRALDADFPGVKTRYETTFGDRYECFSPNYRALKSTFHEQMEQSGLNSRMKFYTPVLPEQTTLF